jgi:glutaredoxin-like protein NrdH
MSPNTHKVKAYTLSTCGWCKKTKALLNALEVPYEYIDMDKLSGDELTSIRDEVARFNPRVTFPTLVIDDGKQVIVGFDEEEIKRCFKG